MIIKFFYREEDNIVYRQLKVEGLVDDKTKPYLLINNVKYIRPNIIGEIIYEYEEEDYKV